MSRLQTVYALSTQGYFSTQRPANHPTIVRANQKNIHLNYVVCNEVWKGQSYFRDSKQEELYRSTRSLPHRSHMFKSQITQASSHFNNDQSIKRQMQMTPNASQQKRTKTLVGKTIRICNSVTRIQKNSDSSSMTSNNQRKIYQYEQAKRLRVPIDISQFSLFKNEQHTLRIGNEAHKTLNQQENRGGTDNNLSFSAIQSTPQNNMSTPNGRSSEYQRNRQEPKQRNTSEFNMSGGIPINKNNNKNQLPQYGNKTSAQSQYLSLNYRPQKKQISLNVITNTGTNINYGNKNLNVVAPQSDSNAKTNLHNLLTIDNSRVESRPNPLINNSGNSKGIKININRSSGSSSKSYRSDKSSPIKYTSSTGYTKNPDQSGNTSQNTNMDNNSNSNKISLIANDKQIPSNANLKINTANASGDSNILTTNNNNNTNINNRTNTNTSNDNKTNANANISTNNANSNNGMNTKTESKANTYGISIVQNKANTDKKVEPTNSNPSANIKTSINQVPNIIASRVSQSTNTNEGGSRQVNPIMWKDNSGSTGNNASANNKQPSFGVRLNIPTANIIATNPQPHQQKAPQHSNNHLKLNSGTVHQSRTRRVHSEIHPASDSNNDSINNNINTNNSNDNNNNNNSINNSINNKNNIVNNSIMSSSINSINNSNSNNITNISSNSTNRNQGIGNAVMRKDEEPKKKLIVITNNRLENSFRSVNSIENQSIRVNPNNSNYISMNMNTNTNTNMNMNMNTNSNNNSSNPNNNIVSTISNNAANSRTTRTNSNRIIKILKTDPNLRAGDTQQSMVIHTNQAQNRQKQKSTQFNTSNSDQRQRFGSSQSNLQELSRSVKSARTNAEDSNDLHQRNKTKENPGKVSIVNQPNPIMIKIKNRQPIHLESKQPRKSQQQISQSHLQNQQTYQNISETLNTSSLKKIQQNNSANPLDQLSRLKMELQTKEKQLRQYKLNLQESDKRNKYLQIQLKKLQANNQLSPNKKYSLQSHSKQAQVPQKVLKQLKQLGGSPNLFMYMTLFMVFLAKDIANI